MKLAAFHQTDKKLQDFKNYLLQEVRNNDSIHESDKNLICITINDKFSEQEYIALLDNNENILMATYISYMSFVNERDRFILNDFDGLFVELIYSMDDMSFDEKSKQVNKFLNLLSKEYPNILLYRENIKTNVRFYKPIKDHPSIFDETELISFDSDYAVSKESTFSIKDRLETIQKVKEIKYVKTKHINMNNKEDYNYFTELVRKHLRVYNKSKYNQMEGLDLSSYSEIYDYNQVKNQYLMAIAVFEDGKEMIVGLLSFIDKEVQGYDYIQLNYVTTHKGYRQKGIAKQLYIAFNNQLEELNKTNQLFVIPQKIKKGEHVDKLTEIRKNIIQNIEMYDSLKELKKAKRIKF